MSALKSMDLDPQHIRPFICTSDTEPAAGFDRCDWYRLHRAAHCWDATKALCPRSSKEKKTLWCDQSRQFEFRIPPGLVIQWVDDIFQVTRLPDEQISRHRCRKAWKGKPKYLHPATTAYILNNVSIGNRVLGWWSEGSGGGPGRGRFTAATFENVNKLVPGMLLGMRITATRTVAEELHAGFLNKCKLARPHRLEHASFITRFQQWLLENPPSASSNFIRL